MDDDLINVQNLRPFPRFFYTIGILPTSFKVSLTYEEQMLELIRFLKEELIPNLNQNTLATKELQDKFVELVNYVDHYFDTLDIQSEVNTKLDEMAASGDLAEIINQEIFGELNDQVTANTNNINNIIKANFENPTMPPFREVLGNSPKFVSFNPTNNTIQVVQRNSNGYLIYQFDNTGGDTSSSSVGVNWDLIRLKKIQFSQFAYCFKDTYASTVGTLSTLHQPASYGGYFETAMNHTVLPYYTDVVAKNKSSMAVYGLTSSDNTTPSQVTYNLKYNVSGKANVLFLVSQGSSTDVDIIVNGKTIANLDLSKIAYAGTAGFYTYEFSIEQQQADSTGKICEVTLKNNDLTKPMYFACMNYLRLEDYDGRDIDSFKATSSGKYYVNSNGASDYAIYDYDLQKFMGSYHGGETAIQQLFTQPNLVSNAVNYNSDYFDSGIYINKTLPAAATWFIVPSFEILQVTNLNNKARMLSIFDFNNDGIVDMSFNFHGDVNTNKFFTGLTSNSLDMDLIKYPNNAAITSGENMVFKNNGLVNFASNTCNLKMDINYAKFPNTYIQNGYENGYVNATTGYNKFYSYAIFNPGGIRWTQASP